MPTIRLFVAVDTPREIRDALTGLRDRLKHSGADVRWESPEKFHITLKFIGDAPEELLPDFVSLLEGVAAHRAQVEIRYGGIGCFPDRHDPRVIWVGVADPRGLLADLAQEIEDGCAVLGVPRERRGFHAHVTLGRVKSRRNLGSLLATMESATFENLPATVSAMLFMKSELTPGGSVYTTLKQLPLHT